MSRLYIETGAQPLTVAQLRRILGTPTETDGLVHVYIGHFPANYAGWEDVERPYIQDGVHMDALFSIAFTRILDGES